MSRRLPLLSVVLLGACGGGPTTVPSAPPTPTPTATPVEDLNMALEDFAQIPGLTKVPGRSYFVANLLGHQDEALAVAGSADGGTFPVGSIVQRLREEPMVKRRRGYNPATNDWEFFGIAFAGDGTPQKFVIRGGQETTCFQCHQSASTPKWDYICDHP